MTNSIDPTVLTKAQAWLDGNYDEETKAQIREMIDNNPTELVDSFYRDLEFGTGGLRGIMGPGTNRMNRYTVGMATQGLANYLLKNFEDEEQISLAIAYDCRNNNTFFAKVTSDVLTANGIKVYLFDALRPTPELSFAIRHLECESGIVITASHNPKEYNGYKVYWNDGAQLVSPHDKNVIAEVQKIKSIDEVNFESKPELIEIIGEEIDEIYTDLIQHESLSPEIIERQRDLKIVYTPIHGTGVKLAPMALEKFGFTNIYNVPQQDVVDGNFPTVISPNPEESEALSLALKKAEEVGADLVMATDPDSDRVGIAVRKPNKEFVLLNGNQTAALLYKYILSERLEKGLMEGNEFHVKTIVTSELLNDIAISYQLPGYDVLTGFKFIADIIKQLEGEKKFVVGGEESYGYLIGDFVRDKDAISACAFIAEAAAWAADQGKTLYEMLIDIYVEYGFYYETLKSIVRKGKAGAEEIQAMMEQYRTDAPTEINGSFVTDIKDYQLQIHKNLKEGTETAIDLPKSNVIQFFTEDGSKITMRPSGTEPKIKFYFGVKGDLSKAEDFEAVEAELKNKIEAIKADLGI